MNILRRTSKALRAFTRAFSGYDLTGNGGRWPTSYMLNAPISQQLAAARLASRKISYQAENNALVASIIQHGVTAIVGDGPTVRPAHPGSEIADRRGWPPGAGGGVLDPVFKYQIEPGELPVHT